jgi:AraC-like DNA-binding protein
MQHTIQETSYYSMIDNQSYYEHSYSTHSLVSHFWHMHEIVSGTYPLYATTQWGMVFSELNGKWSAKIIGPRLTPSQAFFEANEYFIGIVLHGATSLKETSKNDLLDQILPLPIIDNKEFVLREKKLQIPSYHNLNTLVSDLITSDVISAAPIAAISHRDKQRKVKRYVGLSLKQIEQANRVEKAIDLLSKFEGLSSTASQVGFSDQAHMTRDFKKFVGLTPLEVARYFSKSS